ncbi:MFS transporter [Plectonema cf. radiosum LEGE 06105]|uniref:MFS transporter n=1 Tax=Plectonema cf. radiosum LEGE 06105 TaxID=945769 RepID=A0A8J7K0E9_9CYAN|nr:MFS transporter [Plectonema radiosum]MBE9211257.1 MFS transporter [Plectonema cf. radiosum LEGE 06105]
MSLLAKENRKQIPTLLVLLVCGSLTTMTGSVVSPIMPEIKEQLAIDPRWVGTLVSMHCLTIFLFSPIFGILADRIGKVKVLIPSLICYAIFGSIGGLMQSFTPLLISRALLGAASGGVAAASIGILSSMYEGERRTRILGYTTSALAIASIIFPLLGGLLGSINWRFTFFLYGLGLPAALIAYLILPKQKRQSTLSIGLNQKDQLIQSLTSSSTLTLFIALALTSAIFYVVIIYAPLHFKQAIGADTVLNGAILASRAIGAAVISAVGASKLAKRLGSAKAIALGFILMAVTLITIPFVEQIYLILPTAIIFGMGFGIVMPNLYDALSKSNPPQVRSSVLAIGTGASNLGQFFSPIFLGPVWKNGGIAVFFVGAAVSLVTTFLSIKQSKALEKAKYDRF